MNKKGQALVEFVLILPIFLFILMTIVDFGRIFNEKNLLENDSLDIVNFYKQDKNVKELYKDYDIDIIKTDDNYIKFNISSKIKIFTPGLNLIFGKEYKVEVERYIPYE